MSMVTVLSLLVRFRAESVEEAAERRSVLALVCPDDPLRDVVDNDGDVLMVPPVRQLVDADVFEVLEEKASSRCRGTTRWMMAPTVRHAMRMVSATIVWLACWAGSATWSSKSRVKPTFGSAQGTISMTTPHRGQSTLRRV